MGFIYTDLSVVGVKKWWMGPGVAGILLRRRENNEDLLKATYLRALGEESDASSD